MVWLPKKQALVTSGEVSQAKSLLPPNPLWRLGVIEESGHIQYRGAYHPNSSGSGTHPGVEVWTDVTADQYGATTMAEDFGTTTPEERELVLAAGMFYGYPRDELYHTVRIESGWKPDNYYHSELVAPNQAGSGLIGFMPTTLLGLGWPGPRLANGRPDMTVFRKLSSKEQAEWVGRYFKGVAGRWKYPGDTYVAVAGSKFVGWPDDAVAYTDTEAANDAVSLNPGWNPNKDGEITVGEIRQTLIKRLSQPVPAKVEIPNEWLADLSAKLDAYKPGKKGGSPMAPPKVPDPDSLLSQEEWLSLLALSLLEDADKRRYCLLPPKTENVIRRFQRANKLTVDGIPGTITLGKLVK